MKRDTIHQTYPEIFSLTLDLHRFFLIKLRATISDHLQSIPLLPHVFLNLLTSKIKINESEWSNFDQKNVLLNKFSVDWNKVLQLKKRDI